MSHSFTNLLYHIVFATKERQPWIDPAWQTKLFATLGNILRANASIPLEINGMPDHVHLLAKLPPTQRLCDILRAVKARSSFWVHKRNEAFAWQTGYGAFSVSQSQVDVVRCYIQNQQEHHKANTFPDEMRALVRLHGLEIDEKLLWE